jgi:D-glycero-alpha-D-manno-heptose-7-phosphate kinase
VSEQVGNGGREPTAQPSVPAEVTAAHETWVATVIVASVPVRICDNGGWTDTWFGGPGRVLNIAVAPGVEVVVRPAESAEPVVLDLETTGERYSVVPGAARVARNPLVEAAVDVFPPPRHVSVEFSIRSAVPPGCGAGTSAAVAVALVGALAAVRGEKLSPRDAAYAAHRLEVGVLGRESGIQDQLSAAFGGINHLEIDEYPDATVQPLPVWDELGSRLTLVFLGRAHESSEVHRQVIENLGPHEHEVLARLREAAKAGRAAVVARDLEGFGRSMIANTDAQRSLHADLVGADATRVIDAAAAHGAIGWKVNGAGGDGGSLTVLSATHETKAALDRRVAAMDARYRVLPIRISSSGLQIRGDLDLG